MSRAGLAGSVVLGSVASLVLWIAVGFIARVVWACLSLGWVWP